VEKKAMKETAEGVIGFDDSSSSEETPNSVAKTLRPSLAAKFIEK
jgi:hypothetical protein